MAGEDELELRASLDDAVSTVLARIDARLEATERKLDELGGAGREAGAGIDAGAKQAEQGLGDLETQTDKTTTSTEKLKTKIKETTEETKKSTRENDKSSSGWEKLTQKIMKSAKSAGGFGRIIKGIKFAIMAAGVQVLGGAVSALGAALAIAAGHALMAGAGLAAIGPIGLAAMLGMKAAKLGIEEMKPQVEAFGKLWDGLGKRVANGGMRSGLEYLTKKARGFSQETAQGFGWIGGSIGRAERSLGDFLNDGRRLDQTEKTFWSLSNTIDNLTPAVTGFGGGLMDILTAALPASENLSWRIGLLGTMFSEWTQRQVDSGRATQVINEGLDKMINGVQILWRFLGGLYNILKIASGATVGLGGGLTELSIKFRNWTASTEGQAKIAQYFQEALPAIREFGLLIADAAKGIFGMVSGDGLAPLINQIRTEALPAFFDLFGELSDQGGLIPALLDGFTELAKTFTSLDLSGMTTLAQAFADIVEFLGNMIENTPGLSWLVSTFALWWVVGGAVLTVLGGFMTAWTWLTVAITGTGELTLAQMLLNKTMGGFKYIGNMFAAIWGVLGGGAGVMTIVRTAATFMWTAITGPVGLVVLAIAAVIAIVILLWNNCEWFRDAVMAVWEWIQVAAINTWEWIKNAAAVTWDAIVGFVQGAIDVISTIVNWLWTNIIQPIWQVIAAAAQIYWNIISFAVQVAVYIIIGIITLLALILQGIWWVISTVAVWVWQNIILPIIQFVAGVAIAVWTAVAAFFTWLWGIIVQQATFAWQTVILPVIMFVANMAIAIWNGVVAFFTWLWGIIVQQATFAWNTVIAPIFGVVADIAMAVWRPISAFFSWLFGIIADVAGTAWGGIQKGASVAADVVKGVWDGVVGVMRGVWNFLANGWNSIPDITVPDWVPLIGGQTFGLPKLPTFWHGGRVEYTAALVGEHGPEPLIGPGGNYMGMLGTRGPEIATGLPPGGYVVPNLSTLSSMPSLLRGLPSGVGRAVAGNVPGYGEMLRPAGPPPVPPPAAGRGGDRELAGALRGLAVAVAERPPPISANGADIERQVTRALRRNDRERELRGRYKY